MEEIIIPENVQTIGEYSYSATELDSLIIEGGSVLVTIWDVVSILKKMDTHAHLLFLPVISLTLMYVSVQRLCKTWTDENFCNSP